MWRQLIDKGTIFIAWLKRRQRIHPRAETVKVNLGSGLAVAPGWIHVDGSLNSLLSRIPCPRFIGYLFYKCSGAHNYYSFDDYWRLIRGHIFVHHNLAYGVPFEDGTIDYCYTSHFLEHLNKDNQRHLLKEIFRALKPGGLLRICVPDLKYAIELYHQGRKEKMLEDFFFIPESLGYYARHRYLYDFEMLSKLLAGFGFRNIQQRAFQTGNFPDIGKLDVYPEETLYLEAEK